MNRIKSDWRIVAGLAAFIVGVFLIWYGNYAGARHQVGMASYYSDALAGKPTASGERYDPAKLTAAYHHLPLGTRLRVTNLKNGKSVVVRINDRGPYADNRIIDLSWRAAQKLGMLEDGVVRVEVQAIDNQPAAD
ncbi:MAG: septal ring lytic transglycosylase RlpA family protein [Lentisphaeria bacterium]